MQNKKILYILTFIITLFTFNINVNAAQELTCVYKKALNNVKVVLVQNYSGQKFIYTNKNDAQIKESTWVKQTKYNINLKEVTNELDSTNSKNLSSCPQYSEVKELGTKEISFYSDKKATREQLEKEFLTSSIVGNTPTSNSNNITSKELTCVYKKGTTTRKVILTQDAEGIRTVYTNENNESLDGVDWVADKYPINIFNESLNSYGYLDSCPKYTNAPLMDDKIDFFDIKGANWDKLAPEELESSYDEVKEIGSTTASVPEKGEGSLIEIDPNDTKYTGWCKYKKMLDSGEYHYVQINYGASNILITEYDPEKIDDNGKNYSGQNEYKAEVEYSQPQTKEWGNTTVSVTRAEYIYSFKIDKSYNYAYFLGLNDGGCPPGIKVDREDTSGLIADRTGNTARFRSSIATKILTKTNKGELYSIDNAGGTNPITGEELSVSTALKPIQFNKVNVENCADLLGDEVAGYLNTVWNIVKIGIPIALMILGIIDFVQVVFSGKEDAMKKAQEKFIKRVIIAIAIFLIPTILTFLLKIANGIWSNIGTDICGIIF